MLEREGPQHSPKHLCLIFFGLAAVLSTVLVSGCPEKGKLGPANRTGSNSVDEVSLPPEWPIDALTVPKLSTKGQLPLDERGRKGNDPGGYTAYIDGKPVAWRVAFKNSMRWDKLIEYVDSRLLPLGFSKENWQLPGALEPRLTYVSPDGHFIVIVGAARKKSSIVESLIQEASYFYNIQLPSDPK